MSVQFGAYRPGCLCVINTRKAMIPLLIWCFKKKNLKRKQKTLFTVFVLCVLCTSAACPSPLGDWTSRNEMRGPGMMSQTVDGRKNCSWDEAGRRFTGRVGGNGLQQPHCSSKLVYGGRLKKKKKEFKTIWDSDTASANGVTDGV